MMEGLMDTIFQVEKRNKEKKQIPLRLSPSLYAELMQWAEADLLAQRADRNICLPSASDIGKGRIKEEK